MTRTPIPNCPQPETPIRERAWTDEQRLARLRELAELWKAGDFEERECAEKVLAILDADGAAVSSNDVLGRENHNEGMTMDSIQISTLTLLAGKWQSEADNDPSPMQEGRRAALRECADALRTLCELRFEDCPHAAPFRYCQECVASPCPIGLGKPAA